MSSTRRADARDDDDKIWKGVDCEISIVGSGVAAEVGVLR